MYIRYYITNGDRFIETSSICLRLASFPRTFNFLSKALVHNRPKFVLWYNEVGYCLKKYLISSCTIIENSSDFSTFFSILSYTKIGCTRTPISCLQDLEFCNLSG